MRARAASGWGALLVVLALTALAAPPAVAQEAAAGERPAPQTNLADVADEVMCPICGIPLDQALEAPQAEEEREFIRELIAKGLTKDQIKDRLVANYGEDVLAVPDTEGFDLTAWVVPVVGVLLAAVGIAVGLRRWRREGTRRDDEPPDEAPSDSARLDEDLARYEL